MIICGPPCFWSFRFSSAYLGENLIAQIDYRASRRQRLDECIGILKQLDAHMLAQEADVEDVFKGVPHRVASGVVKVAAAKRVGQQQRAI